MIINTFLYKNEKLEQKNLNIKAIYDKTIHGLNFKENETIVQLEQLTDKITLIRENNEHIFKLTENSCSILLKEVNQEFDIKIINYDSNYTEKEIIIKYTLETEEEIETKYVIKMENDV